MTKQLDLICEVVHEALRTYTRASGQSEIPPYHEAPDWMLDATLTSVEFALANPEATPGAQHDQWVQTKLASGWTLGDDKDPDLKTHPMLIPFAELPPVEQRKDALLNAIVCALSRDDLLKE